MKITNIKKITLIVLATCLLTACQPVVNENKITGYVEAEIRLVAAPQAGWITEQPSKEGDAISINEVLFKLDSIQQIAELEVAKQNQLAAEANLSDIQKGARPAEVNVLKSQLQEAKARVVLAKSELKRNLSLVNKGLASAEQLDLAKTDSAVTQAQVQTILNSIEVAGLGGRIDSLIRAEAQLGSAVAQTAVQQYRLSQRTIVANLTGLVHEVFYHVGEYANNGSPVMSIRLINQDKVRFHVSQSQLHKLSIGQNIKVKIDGMNQFMSAKISYIASSAEFTPPVIYSKDSRAKLVFLVEAQLGSSDSLNPGQPVDIVL